MAEEDQCKTAITTNFGLFVYRRMCLGLRHAAQMFQSLIHTVLRDLHFAKAYMDDILVASSNLQEHLEHLEKVFHNLQNNGLFLKSK